MGKRKEEEVEAEEPVTEKKKKKKQKVEEEEPEPVTEKKKKKKAVEEEEEVVTEKKKKKKKVEEEEEEEVVTEKKKKKDKEAAETPKSTPAKSPKKKAPEPEEEDEDEEKEYCACLKGLPYKVDEEKIQADFAECGKITNVKLLKDRESGWSKGIAFVTFATKAALAKALEWNETDYEGRTIKVNEADGGKNKGKDGKGKGKGKGKGPGEKPEGCKSVIVKNIKNSVSEDDLWEAFNSCGSLSRVKLLTDRETGESKGMAFLDFDDEDDVDVAIKLNGNEVHGQAVYLDYSRPKGEKGEGKDGKGKGKGKDGKGKGKGKGKGDSAAKAKSSGSIQDFQGAKKTFDDDDDSD